MDAQRKKNLDDFMAAVPEEELKSEKPSDTISLDEPKRHIWRRVIIFVVILGILAGVAYTGYRVYTSSNVVKAEDKIEGSVDAGSGSTAKTPAVVSVYVNADGGLNLRASASSDATVLLVIPNQTKLTVLADSDGWLQVAYGGQTGWISKDLTQAP